jgi:hypothetical protein
MTMQPSEIPNQVVVTWWCCRCNRSGRLTFHNQNSVGERLDAAKGDHKVLSPDCELDWYEVIVRTELEENRR